ncbi:MAG: hypothetical protein EXS10_00065 [Phycisphaerales bacterium]|nr:hypothetical protein [Phycisphaerales bacterium]
MTLSNAQSPKTGLRGFRQKLRGNRRLQSLLWLAAFGTVVWAKPMGLLLWARLRVLTNLPRTAIADDPQARVDDASAPKERVIELPDFTDADPFRLRGCRLSIPHTPPLPAQVSNQPSKSCAIVADVTSSLEAADLVARRAERFRVHSAGNGLSCAVINGQAYRLGDELDMEGLKFQLIEIREAGVILGHGERRFEIRIGPVGS